MDNATTKAAGATAVANGAADAAKAAADNANTAAGTVAREKAELDKSAKTADAATTRLKAALSKYNSRTTARSVKAPLGDYIPCLFDDTQNYDLRARPTRSASQPLTAGEVDGLAKSIADLLTPPTLNNKPTPIPDNIEIFLKHLSQIQPILNSLTSDRVSFLILQQAAQDNLTSDQIKQITSFLQAITGPETYDRPNDVSCSFSVLQWHETSDEFGRRVANDYVALEVNVRNLNTQNEFLVHDIQVAVDTGLSPYEFGRFQASRDKQVVRGVVQRGQSEDRRNIILNVLTAAGAILAPINSAVAQTIGGLHSDSAINLGLGVAVFQGPFLAGYSSLFPDHTVEYINHLNDLAFSPSSTSKTVVPVQGSVPLVTFLAEKPLEQLPFVHCGDTPHFYRTEAGEDPNTYNKVSPPAKPSDEPPTVNQVNCQLRPTDYEDNTYDTTLTGRLQKTKVFRDWSGAALNIFEHRVFVVVGGVHIQELTGGPLVDSVSGCPLQADGININLAGADTNGNISCTLNGSHLDQVASIKLEQGTTKTVAATVTPAADGNSAPIGFKASDVNGASGSYEIFLTLAGGKDTDSKASVSFNSPNISSISYQPATLDQTQQLIATVSGTHLDRISAVVLVDSTGTNVWIPGQMTSTSTGLTVKFAKTDLAKLGKGPFLFKYNTLDDKAGAPPTAPGTQVTNASIQLKQ